MLGIEVTDDPSRGGFVLAMNASSYGTSDHSGQVTPRSCVGVVFTGEHEVYGATNFEAIKTQTFETVYGRFSGRGLSLLEQTAVVLRSANEAERLLTSSQAPWDACANGEVDVTLGYENWRGFRLGSVERQDDLLIVPMAAKQMLGSNPGIEACQQVIGVRDNVVVGTRSCNYIEQSPDILINTPADPNRATNDAARMARAMLAKVKV